MNKVKARKAILDLSLVDFRIKLYTEVRILFVLFWTQGDQKTQVLPFSFKVYETNAVFSF
jgi:hypothetical protein